MDSLQEITRKNFSQKFQGNRLIGALALRSIREYFDIHGGADSYLDEEIVTGYVKFTTLFLKTSDQSLKIQLFKEKKNLISTINDRLAKLGYLYKIQDIRLK